MRRILITGGTGFVGPHLIRHLKNSSSRIVVLSSGSGTSGQEPGIEYCEVDLRGRDNVGSVVRDFSPDEIYHLAAISAVNVAWNSPQLTFDVNVLGTYNLFEAAMSLPSPPRILNISTSHVYASAQMALSEDSLVRPENPYAASKAMAELLAVQYRRHRTGGIITARPFNHTGPGQSTNFVLPSIAKQFAEIQLGKRPPKIAVGNIGVRRDFTDVRDVVRAYRMLLSNGTIGEAYNVCRGSAVSLADIFEMFQSAAGVRVSIETDQERLRANDALQTLGNPTKLHEATGWSPEIPLERSIGDLLCYWRLNAAATS